MNFVPAMTRIMAYLVVPFWWHKVCQDGKVTYSLRYVVPSVTHKLRTVHEMHVHLTISS